MPAGRRSVLVAGKRPVRRQAPRERQVAVSRRARPAGAKRAQLIVTHARQQVVGIAVAGHVVAGDAHAPDPQLPPAFRRREQARRIAGRQLPQLLLAAAVVLAVVAEAQCRHAGPVPIAEQRRKAAMAGSQILSGRERPSRSRRPVEDIVVACAKGSARPCPVDIVAHREGRPVGAALPRRREGRRPGVAAVEAPGLVGPREPAPAATAQQHVLSDPQDCQVRQAVTIDVQRIGPADPAQPGLRRRDRCEPQRPARRPDIPVERRHAGATGEEQVDETVGVAIERGDAAADEIFEATRVAVVDPGNRRFLDKQRRLRAAPCGRHGGHGKDAASEETNHAGCSVTHRASA